MIVAIIAVVAIAGSMVYYFVFFRPGIERAEVILQEQKLKEDSEKQKIEKDILELERKKLEQETQKADLKDLTFEQLVELLNAVKK